MGLPCTPDSCHPLVAAASAYHDGTHTRFENSALDLYYRLVRPGSVAEALDIRAKPAQWRMRWLSPLFADVPWRRPPGIHVWRRKWKSLRKDVGQYGVRVGAAVSNYFGPSADDVARLEWQRICELVDSISSRGYQPKGPVGGVLLCHGGEKAVMVKGGQHRVAVLAALGYSQVTVAISREKDLVKRSEARDWPAVRHKAMSREQALQVFDRVLEGQPPGCMADYREALQSVHGQTGGAGGQ